jgi:eukaryotic-like serine/threonine-protein kinase
MTAADESRPKDAPSTVTHQPSGDDPDRTRTQPGGGPDANVPVGSAMPAVAIPGFELIDILGQGGMGIVYRARQIQLNRVVALKMVQHQADVEPAQVTRLLAEAEAVAAVRHPHVVQVFQSGRAGDRPFFAMELLDGGNLAQRLRAAGRLSPAEAAALIERVARGVHAAHAQGIIHRDLKPSNVLFDAAGEPKVADFGLARRATSELTRTRNLMGTPAYMAPEQADGRGEFVGPPADVWALGVILYECLTGKRPFDGSDMWAVIRQATTSPCVPPGTVAPGIPRDLERVCLHCLEKEPGDRYQSAGELAEDLRRFRSGESVAVRDPGTVERVYKWVRRQPALAATYGMVGVTAVVAALGIGAAALWQNAEARRQDADTARAGEARARDEAEAAREALAVTEYARTVDLAHREYEANNPFRARQLLASCREDLRNWEWRYVQQLCGGELLTFRAHAGPVFEATFNSDGTQVVTAGEDGTARVWDVRTGATVAILEGHALAVWSAAFAADGSGRVVTRGADQTVRIWAHHTGAVPDAVISAGERPGLIWAALDFAGATAATLGEDGVVRLWDAKDARPLGFIASGKALAAAFRPRHPHLLTATDDGVAQIWDLGNPGLPKELVRLTGHSGAILSSAFSADGDQVITAGDDGSVRVWDARTGAAGPVLKGHAGPVWSAAFSPDGALVVSRGADQSPRVWNAVSGVPVGTLSGHDGPVWSAAFSPDGTRVVTAGEDGAARVWDARAGTTLAVLKGHDGPVWSAAFNPDGTQVVTAGEDGTTRVWDARPGVGEALALRGHGGKVWAAAFSPDRSRVATASADGTARLWDLRLGRVAHSLRGHKSPVLAVAFSPTGDRVVTASADGSFREWDAATGAALRILRQPAGNVTVVALGRDGTLGVGGREDGTLTIWDGHTGADIVTLKGHRGAVYAAAFNAGGSRVATAGEDEVVRVWDTRTGDAVATLRGHTDAVFAAVFSADGRYVATGGGDGTARVWDLDTEREKLLVRGDSNSVWSVGLSPDGLRLVSGGSDRTLKLWDTRTGAELLTLGKHSAGVRAVAFSPDGAQLVAAAEDGLIRLWNTTAPPRRPSSKPIRGQARPD